MRLNAAAVFATSLRVSVACFCVKALLEAEFTRNNNKSNATKELVGTGSQTNRTNQEG